MIREEVLGYPKAPEETGDLAYRATFTRKQLEQLKDFRVNALISGKTQHLWMGPDQHCTFYPVRGGNEFNLVLLCPDNLPQGTRTAKGASSEVQEAFKDWDPALRKIISYVDDVLKWKLCHMRELESWVKGHVALLGDACHPSLPYQAQGAAMAIEDGCVLGILLGRASKEAQSSDLHNVLTLYEKLRKARTTVNVEGSIQNRRMFHMHDGAGQKSRDDALARVNWKDPCPWQWGDIGYMKRLMGFDVIADANAAFTHWKDGKAQL